MYVIIKLETKVPCTLGWPYIEGIGLYCDYFIWCVSCTVVLTCFVMCGCFDNCVGVLVTCVLAITVFSIICTVLFCLYIYIYIFILICFVCTSVGTTATEWKLNCSNSNNNNSNNNNKTTHSRTKLIYWCFIQHCYMFRLFASAIISSHQFKKRMRSGGK